ncbi:alpha/beta fold hydrolase [Paraburkholderia bannensis]|uniref:alpha/beta fold hydrolase n=1 Tax=Paraburkholderia bannensis TaxID=765414 RepID=UPI002AB772B9|nr:alpha/beta fold hydrolase [Paraburkholderia bannensis]
MTRAAGMLLIHGAWQGAWAWDAWLAPMRARGWDPHALDLPGNGADPARDAVLGEITLDTYVEAVRGQLDRFDGPCVIVAHSGAGVIASQVAEAVPERVAAIVYVAGMMLPSGMGYGELVEAASAEVENASGIAPYLVWSDDGRVSRVSRVPADAALAIFLHDCPPDAARRAASLLTAQAEGGRALVATLSAARFGRVPRVYVEATRDRSVLLPLQRRMQALVPGARVRTLECGHVPQLAQPDALARIVCETLAELGITHEDLSAARSVSSPRALNGTPT